MKLKLSSVYSALLCVALVATSRVSTATEINADAVSQMAIKNISQQPNQVFTGGQPSAEQLAVLAKLGIKHVINLRPASEQSFDESATVQQLEMQYHSIPVAGANDVSYENAQQLAELLAKYNNEPVFLHCASSNRVGALIALDAHKQGLSAEAAIEKGRRFGLTSLAPVVTQLMASEQ
ncbi:hypothetical protein [Pseudoalteromonas sp.]|uniref:fused DSP-PTPase phosphatase/NAD kinase-like protein n=1 Tax=Pseudoalteromonas sp. TaxID=53249 RepID=UPI003563839B